MTRRGTVGRRFIEWGDGVPNYADLVAVLITRPSRNAWCSVRAAWLFQAAEALRGVGYTEDADIAREEAMRLVRDAITALAGDD
ncbi:hypothetical protein [Haloechinothrix salitolerans]|uniref:Uncharacterized protein n=1 Tax=Haloechinothrix salitolerans TaxID=926830 RepID=A0ABW2BZP8_9PSEU